MALRRPILTTLHTPPSTPIHIPTWESLFSLSSAQLRAAGVEPARARRYLLHWREKFRNGEFGVGGNAKYVKDGAAELRVIEVPTTSPRFAAATATRAAGHRKVAVNVPAGTEKVDVGAKGEVVPVLGVRGLWEEKRGRIVDGGERRRAEVRAKRRAEERKTSRA
ncbi:telomere length regulation protein [Coniosporium tulheliwenetii]|uniref:Telomere length regulation protein n=1 Tax=Coniosporium tulheliwenetii TaxID=3383036 RepID=A0ACC2ZBZ1_9PEZI|nr:telomere length regulation protein [Cladosporium sp. JES 115]